MYNLMGLNSTAATNQPNVSCTCNCKRSLFQSMEIRFIFQTAVPTNDSREKVLAIRRSQMQNVFSDLVFPYSLLELTASEETCQQIYTPRSTDRLTVPSFLQRDRFSRFQPTYPYLQHEIDLPPTISLSDGEEPPPYQGPCTLQLRDPEQQMELNRESVRAPPNRTIFDSDLIDTSIYNAGPCPPSSNSGISATSYSNNGRMEGPPPTYNEVIGHYPGSTFFQHQQNHGVLSVMGGNRLQHPQNHGLESTVVRNSKDKKTGHPF
ncbi:protein TMEPAI-like [Scyliorhinus canicula]|uniref:protein TMEPAI-like n=1 Tax=Scyliorhinus canicula TaxID=7830 RepID=UPI0018F5A140|nr:protein TMEPAI-like [Scyliorhinus canicula]